MNKGLLLLLVITGLSAASCKKDAEKEQPSPAAAATLLVEYRISSQSAHVNASVVLPGADGQLEQQSVVIDRSYHTLSFSAKSGNFFSVKANNVTPSHQPVQVELYINGTLMKQGVTSSPAQNAIAEGNF